MPEFVLPCHINVNKNQLPSLINLKDNFNGYSDSNNQLNDSFVFQPHGHPKQALIDNEIWPPIFTAKNVRYVNLLFFNLIYFQNIYI